MRRIYEAVEERIATLDFSQIYPGFHMYPFALYDENTVYFADKELPRTGQFYGNTSIEYEGCHIAIWIVTEGDKADLDLFTANIVHEMFHAFQKDTGMIKEWPDDLAILGYPENATNYLMKQNENKLIAETVGETLEKTPAEKNFTLETIHASRSLRRTLIGEFIKQEELVERLEGQAECCGLLALKQLDEEKYEKKLEDYKGILLSGDNMFDIRRVSYYSGALLRLLERESKSEIKSEHGEPAQGSMEKRLQEQREKKEQILRDFFDKERTEHQVDTYICGYDPMNQIRVGNQIWAKNMIYLYLNDRPTMLAGPIVVKLKKGSNREVEGYYI